MKGKLIMNHKNRDMIHQYQDFYSTFARRREVSDQPFGVFIYDLLEEYGNGEIMIVLLDNDVCLTLYNYKLKQTIETSFSVDDKYFELEYCLEGYMDIEVKEKINRFNKNCLSVSLNQKTEGVIIREAESFYKGISICGENKLVENFLGVNGKQLWDKTINGLAINTRLKQYFGIESSLNIRSLFEQIESTTLPFELRFLFYESKIKELLVLILSREMNDEIRSSYLSDFEISQIKLIPDYLYQNRFNLPSIHELSKTFSIKEDTLRLGFKELFNDTPIAYHRRRILERSKELLLYTDQPIEIIAYELGYSNSSNFILAFKRVYKMTPLNYRQSYHG